MYFNQKNFAEQYLSARKFKPQKQSPSQAPDPEHKPYISQRQRRKYKEWERKKKRFNNKGNPKKRSCPPKIKLLTDPFEKGLPSSLKNSPRNVTKSFKE